MSQYYMRELVFQKKEITEEEFYKQLKSVIYRMFWNNLRLYKKMIIPYDELESIFRKEFYMNCSLNLIIFHIKTAFNDDPSILFEDDYVYKDYTKVALKDETT